MKTQFFAYTLALLSCISFLASAQEKLNTFSATNANIQTVGRTMLTDQQNIRSWASGAYMQTKFTGNTCKILINDEVKYGQNHNYIEIVFDNQKPKKILLADTSNILSFTLPPAKEHTVTICKNTEGGVGYIDFCGIRCNSLLPITNIPTRKIEFIGNSITCGMSSDLSETPCGKGKWYDQHNAYMSYGAITARKLNAQYHLSSVSGIGLIHSCCNMTITMPQVYNKIDMREDSLNWDFNNYQPDIITICLGQNDGIQDSLTFCTTYITFINQIRTHYPSAEIVCLSSPMADATLTKVLKSYISFIASYLNKNGDDKVHTFFYSKRYHNGCDDHPDLKEHQLMANELSGYIKRLMKW